MSPCLLVFSSFLSTIYFLLNSDSIFNNDNLSSYDWNFLIRCVWDDESGNQTTTNSGIQSFDFYTKDNGNVYPWIFVPSSYNLMSGSNYTLKEERGRVYFYYHAQDYKDRAKDVNVYYSFYGDESDSYSMDIYQQSDIKQFGGSLGSNSIIDSVTDFIDSDDFEKPILYLGNNLHQAQLSHYAPKYYPILILIIINILIITLYAIFRWLFK